MPPTIVYLLGRLIRRGAEMRSLQLLEAMRRRHPGLRFVVYVTSRDRGDLDEAFGQAGVELVYGHAGMRGMIGFGWTCLRLNAAVAHLNHGMGSGYFAAAAWLAGVGKRVCHFRVEREYRSTWLGRLRGGMGMALTLIFATDIIGVCAAARPRSRAAKRRWRTVYNGVECSGAQPGGDGRGARGGGRPIRVIVLGQLSSEKNYLRPISIVEALAARRGAASIRLRYVGAGSPESMARLRRRIDASPAAAAISVAGLSEQPLAELREADVLLMTSEREGLPGVVLEALSVGTPAVASDIAGAREIADATEGVLLVPPAAADEQWSDAILAAGSGDRARAITDSFQRSPFRLDRHVSAIAAIWDLPASVAKERAAGSRLPYGPLTGTAEHARA